jgi:hypothetical protein
LRLLLNPPVLHASMAPSPTTPYGQEPTLIAPPTPSYGDQEPTLVPPPVTGDRQVGVLLVFYEPTGPVYVEDSATLHPDGTIDLDIPVGQSPPNGTGVQVTIYLPDGMITYEGRITLDPATGTIGLDLNIIPPTTPPMPA